MFLVLYLIYLLNTYLNTRNLCNILLDIPCKRYELLVLMLSFLPK